MTRRRLAALAVLALIVAACSGGSEGTGGELQGTRWVLRSYDSAGSQVLLDGDSYADLEFTAGRARGFAGCTSFDTVYRSTGRVLLVSPAATTLQSCGEEADTLQAAYLGLLSDSRSYTVRRETLTIFGPDRAALLIFDAGARNPLLGRWTVDSFADSPGSMTAPLEGTSLTVTFRLARVAGSSGCNTFDATYGTNGNIVAIGRMATTRLACPDEAMAQETAFLEVLGGVSFVEPRGSTLLLTDRFGVPGITLIRPASVAESPEPSPSEEPTASASASVTPEPSATPSSTAEPSAEPSPTASPTIAPTAAPTASSAPAPTVAPPSPPPATASCTIDAAGGATASIVYPADWFTLETPTALACRFFDPEPITIPPDPLALEVAVTIRFEANLAFADALAGATDPATWDVARVEPYTVAGFPAALVEGTSIDDTSGVAIGTTRYAYLIDLGPNGTAFVETSGTAGETYDLFTSTVDLIAAQSSIPVAS